MLEIFSSLSFSAWVQVPKIHIKFAYKLKSRVKKAQNTYHFDILSLIFSSILVLSAFGELFCVQGTEELWPNVGFINLFPILRETVSFLFLEHSISLYTIKVTLYFISRNAWDSTHKFYEIVFNLFLHFACA